MELDDTAAFRSSSKWGPGPVEFPLPFGRALTAAESYVASLDEATGEGRGGGGGCCVCAGVVFVLGGV